MINKKHIIFLLAVLILLITNKIIISITDPVFNQKYNIIKNSITVVAEGEFIKPGEYVIPKNSTILNLIEKCGGITENADINKIDFECKLINREKVMIPKKIINTKKIISSKVSLNTSNIEQLSSLEGIGSELAKRIIEYRNKNGEFKNIAQVKDVYRNRRK